MKVFLRSLNICPMRRVNFSQYRESLKQNGHQIVDSPEMADKVLVWTCAVRKDFHDNSIRVLKDFQNSGYQVVAAGCLPSINPSFIQEEFHGEVIHFNNDDKEFAKIFGGVLNEAPYPVAEAPILIPLDQYRAQHPKMKIANDDQYIKLFIAEGCTQRCSYCTEVQAFPPFQSYPLSKIVAKAQELVDRTGVKKVALFGDDIGAYGTDMDSNLVSLLHALVDMDPNIQISLKQINPIWWKKYFSELSELIRSKNIFQMLVPIQSANTRILKLMDRNYSSEDLDFLFNSIHGNTEIELETHIICGFPTETVSEWNDTVRFVCNHRFRYVMGNIFMPGEGTKAEKIKNQIDEKEKEQRMLIGAIEMEEQGTVVAHNLSWRAKEHLTHTRIDFMEM